MSWISPPVELFLGFTECYFNRKTIKMIWSKKLGVIDSYPCCCSPKIPAVLKFKMHRWGTGKEVITVVSHITKQTHCILVCTQNFAVIFVCEHDNVGFLRDALCWISRGRKVEEGFQAERWSVSSCLLFNWQNGHLIKSPIYGAFFSCLLWVAYVFVYLPQQYNIYSTCAICCLLLYRVICIFITIFVIFFKVVVIL